MARYADVASDLVRLGMRAEVLQEFSLEQQEEALGAACSFADGYFNERFCLPLVWRFLSLAERDTSSQSAAVEIFDARRLPLALDITEIAEGASVVVSIQESEDGLTGWSTIGSFESAARAGHWTIETAPSLGFIRVLYVIAGGAVTFGVSFDGADLKRTVCDLALYQMLTARGLDPNGRDEILSERHKNAIHWLDRVAGSKIHPGFIDQTPSTDENRPIVYSSPRRR